MPFCGSCDLKYSRRAEEKVNGVVGEREALRLTKLNRARHRVADRMSGIRGSHRGPLSPATLSGTPARMHVKAIPNQSIYMAGSRSTWSRSPVRVGTGKENRIWGDLDRSVADGARQAAGLGISQTADLLDFDKLPSPSWTQTGEGEGK